MKIATIIGARPQFIKASVVCRAADKQQGINEVLIHTGQHFSPNMSDVFFEDLNIRQPDYNLEIGGGTHGQNTGRMIESIEDILLKEKPDYVLVYGDTDSTLAGAIASVKLNIPLAHVEAGLRSYNRSMPEEINRILTDHAADLLFVPTNTATINLEREGIPREKIHYVGDVMYDASIYYRSVARQPHGLKLSGEEFVIATIHRAENTDNPDRMKGIVRILKQIGKIMPIVLPIHPRTEVVLKKLELYESLKKFVHIMGPVGFKEMTWLLSNCKLVLTDSGGIQKEAYFNEKPCMTLRDETEWVELLEEGYNRLVSPLETDVHNIFNEMLKREVCTSSNLYGAGNAAKNIVSIILQQQIES